MKLRNLFIRRAQRERELDEEVRAHLALDIRERMERGENPAEAEANARREFGNVPLVKEVTRDMWGWAWLESLVQDVRYGLRQLRRNPGFTAVVILTLALGIGANTAIFSMVNAVMLRQLPVRSPGQLVLLGHGRFNGITTNFAYTDLYSYPFYREMQQKNRVFSGVSSVLSFLFTNMHGTVGGSPNLETMNIELVSGTYFSMLGVKPIMGRAFTGAEDEPAGGHPIAVASYSWWRRRFGRDPAILGKTVTLESTVYTIVGVAPQGFFGTTVGESPDLWIPLSMEKQISPGTSGLDDKSFQSLFIIGRLKRGVSVGQAQANVNLLAKQLWRESAGSVLSKRQQERLQHAQIQLTPLARGLSQLRFKFALPLQILMALVGLVLLIVCANIANLLMARATARQREIAVRLAVGAGRMRLIRQMLTESLLLALSGGALGVLLATWASHGLLRMVSTGSELLPLNVAPDGRVLTFTFVVSLFTALLFGILPALRATRIDLTASLKEGRGAVSAAGRGLLAKAPIVFQVALSLVLLIGAGLFLRSLVNLANVDTGFNKEDALIFEIDPSSVGYKEDSRLVSLYQQIEQRVTAQPGVRAASISEFAFDQGEWTSRLSIPGRTTTPEDDQSASNNVVGPGYFAAMGIPLMAGRVFGPQDTEKSQKVAVINETMAKRYFPGGSPIGRRFGSGDNPKSSLDIEVVGVVKDAKYTSLTEKPFPAAYYPYTQDIEYFNDLEVRYTGDPGVIISEVRHAVREVNRSLPIVYKNTLGQQVNRSVDSQTMVAQLATFFGILAVLLACIGIYGLMSYAVKRRTHEIGIRMALGAGRSRVLWMVMRESLALVVLGLAVGLPVALAGDRMISSMLFGLSPADPATIVGAAIVLLAFAALAGYLPARRASRVEPMVALRHE